MVLVPVPMRLQAITLTKRGNRVKLTVQQGHIISIVVRLVLRTVPFAVPANIRNLPEDTTIAIFALLARTSATLTPPQTTTKNPIASLAQPCLLQIPESTMVRLPVHLVVRMQSTDPNSGRANQMFQIVSLVYMVITTTTPRCYTPAQTTVWRPEL